MRQFEEFDAIIKIRSGGAFVPRLDCLRWQGRRVRVMALWSIEDRPVYEGEMACQVLDDGGERYPSSWIASGDLLRLN